MKNLKDKKIAVLYGGLSSEREVSLASGKAILEALKRCDYQVMGIDVDQNLAENLRKHQIEVAYLALHGRYGEDGCVQGLLEILQIPYTGASVLASSLAIDKFITKELLQGQDVNLPRHVFLDLAQNSITQFLEKFHFEYPLIIKPSREGSSVGMKIVKKLEDLPEALEFAAEYDPRLLLEEYLPGREVTVAILEDQALPIVEIKVKSEFYDFEAKYTKGKTEYLVPAPLSEELTQELQRSSLEIARHLDLASLARVDFIIHDDTPYFLEVNTLPGMTETSLVPKAAGALGMTFDTLVEKILNTARLKIH